jgi:AcrR family transcriptional regulator
VNAGYKWRDQRSLPRQKAYREEMQVKSSSQATARRTARRQQILDTASQLFSERGYENVTLRAIAEKLGYAHAALYRYFPDKASLLAEICKETFAQLILELDDQQGHAEGPEAQLLAVSLGFVRFGLAHPYHFQVVFAGPLGHTADTNQPFDAIGRSLFERLTRAFITCSKAVGLSARTRTLDASTWWTSLFGTTYILTNACAVITPASSDEVVQRHIQVMWQGFRALASPGNTIAVQKKRDKATRPVKKNPSSSRKKPPVLISLK